VTAPYAVEALRSHHKRDAFSCGEPALDRYLREQASQDVRRRISQVFVAVDSNQSVAGFYTLSASSFERSLLPPDIAKRLPRYPVPAAVIGRLAVDQHHRGRNLGSSLLIDAMRRVVSASAAMAVYAVVVDAKNERAVEFYLRFGFRQFPDTPRRLLLPIDTFLATGL
jgi:ribosomal protein S18 acetylase RimI-like enzyme